MDALRRSIAEDAKAIGTPKKATAAMPAQARRRAHARPGAYEATRLASGQGGSTAPTNYASGETSKPQSEPQRQSVSALATEIASAPMPQGCREARPVRSHLSEAYDHSIAILHIGGLLIIFN